MMILVKNSGACTSSMVRKYEFNLVRITEMHLAFSAGKSVYKIHVLCGQY